ncbi:glycoside hydrolase family 15 protein [Methylomarinum sp. Ch1-1]|uniref:Glycoside hydrolase family 15 protein n=1 Tax=Methylomarinum roseum TaxID=3067653 RepID=A0AAU7NS24_9GAMM|nr:glycoside hydrolase family 15 protein [Methylomarinum sp. Ch1-1]MDP4520210.1 glycoside hydrolase family 15 protein [Methylomarinum sp. Ch1-1]
MSSLELGVVGNCGFNTLINRQGRIVWCCLPRIDGDPVFNSLINGDDPTGGFMDIVIDDFERAEQSYEHNTAILVTRLYDRSGAGIEITDFAPRRIHYERVFRPAMLVRRLRPLNGAPRLRVRVRPTHNYGAEKMKAVCGSNHIRYQAPELTLRLTTDLPITYVLEEIPFLLEGPADMLFGPDKPLRRPITSAAREEYEYTHTYWREWTRRLSIPFQWQDAVIRSAITLKLCSFEESGAVIAAMTTSIPESPGSTRNWDYRYCWLRDAYFVINALNRLGATRTMENYLNYIVNIVASAENSHLQPVYGVTLEKRLVERKVETLAGYRGDGPVRAGNQAYDQIQNDIYGSIILAASQIFFDRRLAHPGTRPLFDRLELIGEQCIRLYNQPDAGLWEFRGIAKVHTFSAVMCWAGCDRLSRIAVELGLDERAIHWRAEAEAIKKEICARAYDAERNTFVDSFEGNEMDASLLLLHELQFLSADDSRFIGTVEAVEKALRRGNHMMRYAQADDFGYPEHAFNICTFWMIGALAAVDRRDEAVAMFEHMLQCRNHLGLLSEDTDPITGELWGNFPQTYSMVGLIHSARVLSTAWEEAF